MEALISLFEMGRSRGRTRARRQRRLQCTLTNPLHSLVVYVGVRGTSKISDDNLIASESTTIARSCLLIVSKTPGWPDPGLPNSTENQNRAFRVPAHVNGPNSSTSTDGNISGYDTRATTHFHIPQQSFQQIIPGRLFPKTQRSRFP